MYKKIIKQIKDIFRPVSKKGNYIFLITPEKKQVIPAHKFHFKGLMISIEGTNNTISIELPNSFENSVIKMDGNGNSISFSHSELGFRNLEILMLQNSNNKILTFGENCSCEGLTIYHHNHSSTLTVGNNVMFARKCCIQVSDSHAVFSYANHSLLNANSSHVYIGDNVWIAEGVTILKNSVISDHCIVAACSVVTKKFLEKHCILGGIPARIIKHNISWCRYSPSYVVAQDSSSIPHQELSFVIQGPLDKKYTPLCLKSIKTIFPLAHTIFSTWKGTDVTSIKYLCDTIIFNDDPGPITHSNIFKRQPFNLNRQIVSSYQGLLAVKTKYAIRLRSDMIVKNQNFLNYFNRYQETDKKYKLFDRKIISFAAYAPYWPNGLRSWDCCIHDYAFFGLTKDLLLLFNIPLMNKTDQFYWRHHDYPFLSKKIALPIHQFLKQNQTNFRYHAEQYIFLKCFEKKQSFNLKLEHMFDFSNNNIELFKKLLVNNFIPLYSERLGLSLPKDFPDYQWGGYTSPLDYTYKEFLGLYNLYANGKEILPIEDLERTNWKNIKSHD